LIELERGVRITAQFVRPPKQYQRHGLRCEVSTPIDSGVEALAGAVGLTG
jgi:hypothetical protein